MYSYTLYLLIIICYVGIYNKFRLLQCKTLMLDVIYTYFSELVSLIYFWCSYNTYVLIVFLKIFFYTQIRRTNDIIIIVIDNTVDFDIVPITYTILYNLI